ncbi:hypothetical protein PFJ87_09g00140 [Encephalitozoon hellem]|uniref:Uncharacterized protein n=1 Tax=Encephalitozoon hellem TaxID=27973 RepID=A0ABY8CQX7_ENCHE|nr:hypothetical protein PFJ87_04g00110 [Encephalitozoon hellem]WEL38545.1 hypothetical protein PFJ87_05g00130 [Encephalitozoon hellem]WEL38746.1 hypothetical protein PFJ87_06g00110 [Encephalitozoon hellem]WEL39387.1 hypothetical protein PFJ87_09g00140 [Encephalitozoon hellem]
MGRDKDVSLWTDDSLDEVKSLPSENMGLEKDLLGEITRISNDEIGSEYLFKIYGNY